ncbi:MAG: ComF family protein [Candidatus Omnitrophica bacterium]|nr:ComF family protein [Candidatus Omnitrophota bacterium]
MLKDYIDGLIDLVYPPLCLLCRKKILPRAGCPTLCAICQSRLVKNTPPFCVKCSRPLPGAPTVLCPSCRKNQPNFDFAWCARTYTAPLKSLIYTFKYGGKTQMRHLFAAEIQQFIAASNFDIRQFDALVPIPLHPARWRERGYNQSELLAKTLSALYAIPVKSLLRRVKPTRFQAGLTRKERWTNISGAFRMNASTLPDKNLLLVDDLLTTGATASEAALTLKNAGAELVGVLTLAVTVAADLETS